MLKVNFNNQLVFALWNKGKVNATKYAVLFHQHFCLHFKAYVSATFQDDATECCCHKNATLQWRPKMWVKLKVGVNFSHLEKSNKSPENALKVETTRQLRDKRVKKSKTLGFKAALCF